MMRLPELPQRARMQLRAAWAEAVGVPITAFDGEGVTWVPRDDLHSVVVVELGTAMAVAAPQRALALLETQHRTTLARPNATAAALPGSLPIGSAHLLFTGTRPAAPRHAVVPGDDRDLVKVRAAVAEDEWSEAGVEPMERHWAVRDGREPLAVAGYQRWHTTIAHIGVVAATEHRGRGYGPRRRPAPSAPRSTRGSSRSGAPAPATPRRCGSPTGSASRASARSRPSRSLTGAEGGAGPSARAEAERVPRRVEEDAERLARLVVVLRRTEPDDGRLALVEVVDDDVEVHLLRVSWPGQSGAEYCSTCWKQIIWP